MNESRACAGPFPAVSVLLVVSLSLSLSAFISPAASLRVGVGTTDITPPLGIPLAGYYHERGADGVMDPLFSKALVIESGGERAALVALDIISLTRAVTDQARGLIEKTTGIPGGRVMISATHAHTGPELADQGGHDPSARVPKQAAIDYTAGLPKLIAESVRLANERLQPVVLSRTEGRCEGLAFNRRYFMRDGSVGWNPGKLNPNIALPAGLTDPEVGILLIEPAVPVGPAGAIATYVNFAMHPDTTGGKKVSADWPGALGRVLASYHGSNHLTLVANGTCGNLNHLDFSWSWPQGGAGEQNRIGAILGAAVFQAYKSLKPVGAGALRGGGEIVELALPEVAPPQVEEARKIVETTRDDHGTNFMRLVRAERTLDVAAREGRPLRAEVQVLAMGRDIAWVGLPGEVFVELGLAIKKRSPFAQTFVVELANEDIGYIPDRRSYAEGNYEPESARCAAGSGEKLVEAAVLLLTRLHEEKL
jgi:neutral ceramidase